MKSLVSLLLLFSWLSTWGQPAGYTTANAHSHNNYEQPFPFWNAWKQQFGSIEADIFLEGDQLIVAHDRKQMEKGWTLDSLYLLPLQQCIASNKGYVYADTSRRLQLMIDIKSAAVPTLQKLVERLSLYPSLTTSRSLRIAISGSRPPAAEFSSWPSYIYFDGELQKTYNADELARIEMMSDNFARYSSWNGKGRIPEKERRAIQEAIHKAHKLGKKVRFWNAPDIINSWYHFMELGVDYINTDHIDEISSFFRQLPDRKYNDSGQSYPLYKPQYRNDGLNKKVKNIILLIGDGTGLPQWYAGYTANKGGLNVFNMRFTGLSKTSSADNYITDSAPGATAFSSGVKTNNRAVGADTAGRALELLPAILRRSGMKTGIITSGDIRDATPAAFYAHQSERSHYAAILTDLTTSPVDIIMGDMHTQSPDSSLKLVKKKFTVLSSADDIYSSKHNSRLLVADTKAGLPAAGGRGQWASIAFDAAVSFLSSDKDGFLLVVEGAQIDHGGHANKLPYVVSEVMDFDKVIGKAMEFADRNGETLVIVTADHETGGLTLTDGNYTKGMISGQFSTEDHTAIPVPVFAYGPQANLFSGVYENTQVFYKILKTLRIE